MWWMIYALVWFGYVYVWTSYSNKEILRSTDWSGMNFRQKLRRVFLFPSWFWKGPIDNTKNSSTRSWLQLWEWNDDPTLEYAGKDDETPALLFRGMVIKHRKGSYKDQSNLVLYKVISVFPLLGLNVLWCTISGGILATILIIGYIPTFVRFLYRTITRELIAADSGALTFLKAEDNTPYGKIESQKRETQLLFQRLADTRGKLKAQEDEVVSLLVNYSDEALAKKTTTLGKSNFLRTKSLLEEKWQEKLNVLEVVNEKIKDVGEAVEQLQELKTMVAVLQHSTDTTAQAEVAALLEQANEVCGNAVALETEVSFTVLAEQGDYPLPAPPSIVKELEA